MAWDKALQLSRPHQLRWPHPSCYPVIFNTVTSFSLSIGLGLSFLLCDLGVMIPAGISLE